MEPRQCWQLWSSALPDQFVDGLIEEIEQNYDVQRASTFEGDTSNHRRSNIRWIDDNEKVRDCLFNFAIRAAQVFGTHIYREGDMQYTEYLSSEGGHYAPHHDILWARNDGFDRKISVTLQLSDPTEYVGGDFSFTEVENPSPDLVKAKGSVLCFPSYLVHQVEPVTSGNRKSIVVWFEGPKWR